MSNLDLIISRVISDEKFRDDFLKDPLSACQEYSLTEDEMAQLRSIDLTELSVINNELETRLSKSFVSLPVMDSNVGEEIGHSSHSNTHSSHNSTGW